MTNKENSELSVQTLLALRQEGDALQVITERLRVKDMGPADHIRTKHEVKLFIESGTIGAGEELIQRAAIRTVAQQKVAQRMNERQGRGQRMGI